MTNRLLFLIIGALVVIAVIVVILAYTYLDIGLTPKSGGTLSVALQSFSTETLDPSQDNKDGLNYHTHLYDFLVGVDPDGRLDTRYGLLSGWQASSAADSFTLTLRDGVSWHDGEQVSSEDVRASFDYYLKDESTCGVCLALKEAVSDIEVVDNENVVVLLASPDVVFPGLLAAVEGDTPLLPAHVIDAEPESLRSSPVGTGPWRFAANTAGEFVVYESNVEYWNAERVSSFDTLNISLVPDESQRIALIESDRIDVAPINAESVGNVKANGFSVDGPKHVLATTVRYFMSYDKDYLTSSLEFRKALQLSLNLEEMVPSVFPEEAATIATGSALFTPVSPGFVEDLPAYPYDPDEARTLLEQSGYAGETVQLLSLIAYGMSEMPRINELIAKDWEAIGINVHLEATEWPAVQPLFQPRPQLFDDYAPAPVIHGAAPARPGGDMNGVRRYLTGGESAMLTYFAPRVGDGIFAQLEATTDDEDRALVLQALNRRTYGEFWAIPILWRHDTYAVNPELTGWQPTNGTPSDLHFETIRRTRN